MDMRCSKVQSSSSPLMKGHKYLEGGREEGSGEGKEIVGSCDLCESLRVPRLPMICVMGRQVCLGKDEGRIASGTAKPPTHLHHPSSHATLTHHMVHPNTPPYPATLPPPPQP